MFPHSGSDPDPDLHPDLDVLNLYLEGQYKEKENKINKNRN